MINSLSRRAGRSSWLALWALGLLLMLFSSLRPLALPDEGRYGEVGRWMVQSGDWLIPRLNGIAFFHKPPFLYWTEAASVWLFGPELWVIRLAPAIHAVLMLLMLYHMTRRLAGEETAWRAGIIFATSLTFLVGGQYVNHDMVVASWISTAIWCFAWSFQSGERPHPGWARAGFAACALGLMTKGLIGLALPGLVLVSWLIWTRQVRKILHLPWASGLLIFLLISVPWFVLAERAYPGMLKYLFVTQQFERYVSSSFNNPQPWWFYLLCIALLAFPWIVFVIYQAAYQIRARSHREAASVSSEWLALCWIWIAVVTIFFSLPKSKLVGYILPVIPAVALLAALGYERRTSGKTWAKALFAGSALLGVALCVAVNTLATDASIKKSSRDIADVLACEWHAGDRLFASGLYPYDLPFYMQSKEPMTVAMNWVKLREVARDNWSRELFESADLDPLAGQSLQPLEVLVEAGSRPGNWLVMPLSEPAPLKGWRLRQKGKAWSVYQSAPERPVSAQKKRLPGCRRQPAQQSQPG